MSGLNQPKAVVKFWQTFKNNEILAKFLKNNLQIIVKDNTEQTALETAYPLFIGHIITAADYEATQGGV